MAVLKTSNSAMHRNRAAGWRSEPMYDVHLRLIEKPIVDFVLMMIELFSLSVTAEVSRANIE